MYKHFIITRFNLFINFGDRRIDKSILLGNEYLLKRFDLFEKYTVKSMLNQSDKDFIWLVIFHKDTPNEFIERINIISQKVKMFIPVYLSEEESPDFQSAISNIISKYEADWYITSRIDNDDAIAPDYVARIHNIFENNKTNRIISFKYGFQYIVSKKLLLKFEYKNNHFLSLVSNKKDINIYAFNHFYINKETDIPVIYEECNPTWIEVIHDTNFANHESINIKSLYPYKECKTLEILNSYNIGPIYYLICQLKIIFIVLGRRINRFFNGLLFVLKNI